MRKTFPIFVIIIVIFLVGISGCVNTTPITNQTSSIQTVLPATTTITSTEAQMSIEPTPAPTTINPNGGTGWVRYEHYNYYSIYKPSDWTENITKTIIPEYGNITNFTVDNIYAPNGKGVIKIIGTDISSNLYGIKELGLPISRAWFTDYLFNQSIEYVKSNAPNNPTIATDVIRDDHYYVINGNPTRRATILTQLNGQSINSDLFFITHGNVYYTEWFSASSGSTQSDASTASDIMRTFNTTI